MIVGTGKLLTSAQMSQTRKILERKGYQTIEREGTRVTLPSGGNFDRVAALFAQGAPIRSALFLTLVSPAEISLMEQDVIQDVIIVGDLADLTCEKVGAVIREETSRGPQRSDPDEEIAASLPTLFRISLPQIDEG